jgi:hypothetical protein
VKYNDFVTFILVVFKKNIFSRNRVVVEPNVAQTCMMVQRTRFNAGKDLFGVSLMCACIMSLESPEFLKDSAFKAIPSQTQRDEQNTSTDHLCSIVWSRYRMVTSFSVCHAPFNRNHSWPKSRKPQSPKTSRMLVDRWMQHKDINRTIFVRPIE